MIEFKGLGILTRWKLPIGLTKCPVLHCNMQFDARLQLVNHYRDNHAKFAVLCSVCRKPIMCHDICNLKRHYSSVHPNEKFPFDTDDQKPQPTSKVHDAHSQEANSQEAEITNRFSFLNRRNCYGAAVKLKKSTSLMT